MHSDLLALSYIASLHAVGCTEAATCLAKVFVNDINRNDVNQNVIDKNVVKRNDVEGNGSICDLPERNQVEENYVEERAKFFHFMKELIRLKTHKLNVTHNSNMTAEEKLLEILNNENVFNLIPDKKPEIEKNETPLIPTNGATQTGEILSDAERTNNLSNEEKNVDLHDEDIPQQVSRARVRKNRQRPKREEDGEPEDEDDEDEIDWIERKSCKFVLTPLLTVMDVKVRECKKLCQEVKSI